MDGNSAVSGSLLTVNPGENAKLGDKGFNMDGFVDRVLETHQPLADEMMAAHAGSETGTGMRDMADFLAVGGAKTGDANDQRNTISAMTALMENIGIPKDKVDQMESYMRERYESAGDPAAAGMPGYDSMMPSFDPAMNQTGTMTPYDLNAFYSSMTDPNMMMDPSTMTDPSTMIDPSFYDSSSYIDPNMYMPKPEDYIDPTTTQAGIDESINNDTTNTTTTFQWNCQMFPSFCEK
jgi:hypothetical protein